MTDNPFDAVAAWWLDATNPFVACGFSRSDAVIIVRDTLAQERPPQDLPPDMAQLISRLTSQLERDML